jgi:hypothetical protein
MVGLRHYELPVSLQDALGEATLAAVRETVDQLEGR